MVLPHGLSARLDADAQLGALQSALSLCALSEPWSWRSACSPLPFTLRRTSAGSVQANVTTLAPGTLVRVRVVASSSVLDGFEQPLVPSQADFWTRKLPGTFQPPGEAATLSALK